MRVKNKKAGGGLFRRLGVIFLLLGGLRPASLPAANLSEEAPQPQKPYQDVLQKTAEAQKLSRDLKKSLEWAKRYYEETFQSSYYKAAELAMSEADFFEMEKRASHIVTKREVTAFARVESIANGRAEAAAQARFLAERLKKAAAQAEAAASAFSAAQSLAAAANMPKAGEYSF